MARTLAASIILGCFAMSCATAPAPAPQPGHLRDYERQEARNTMFQLNRHLMELETHFSDSAPNAPETREDAVKYLNALLATAEGLQKDQTASKHPDLSGDLPYFINTLKLAVAGAAAEPPNYYYAGGIARACVRCHSVASK